MFLLCNKHLPSSRQIRMTFVKTFVEKLTAMSSTCRSGRRMRSFLCIGVNQSLASAWTPYWSSVERVRASQMFLSGHQSPWSDQSIAMSKHIRKHIDRNNTDAAGLFANRFMISQFVGLQRHCLKCDINRIR